MLPAIIFALTLSFLVPELFAQSGTQDAPKDTPVSKAPTTDKAPYNMLYWDFGGDAFNPRTRPPLPALCCAPSSLPVQQQAQQAELAAASFSSVPGFRMVLGVRPLRYVEIDGVDLDILGHFNGFGNRTSTFQCVSGCTGTSTQTIGSVSTLISIGARGVLPLFRERLLLSAGGGFGWLLTNEYVQTAANVTAQCSSCRSVGGHGATEIGEIMYFPKRYLGIGFHVRNVQINSSGLNANDPAIYPPGTKFKDRFLVIGGSISLRGLKRN